MLLTSAEKRILLVMITENQRITVKNLFNCKLRVGTRVSEEDAILGHGVSRDTGECADAVPKRDVLP